MSSFRGVAFLALIACSNLFFTGCVGGKKFQTNSNSEPATPATENANTTKTNVEELGILVNIPYEVEDIVWKDDPTKKKLLAVLRFSPADSGKLIAEAESIRPAQQVNLPTEAWFPAELIAQSDMSGDDTLNGKSYAATNFLLEPYVTGSITRIENTDYFILEASE